MKTPRPPQKPASLRISMHEGFFFPSKWSIENSSGTLLSKDLTKNVYESCWKHGSWKSPRDAYPAKKLKLTHRWSARSWKGTCFTHISLSYTKIWLSHIPTPPTTSGKLIFKQNCFGQVRIWFLPPSSRWISLSQPRVYKTSLLGVEPWKAVTGEGRL